MVSWTPHQPLWPCGTGGSIQYGSQTGKGRPVEPRIPAYSTPLVIAREGYGTMRFLLRLLVIAGIAAFILSDWVRDLVHDFVVLRVRHGTE